MKKIILMPAIFIGSTLLYAEESAPTTYESIRIDQNVYLTDTNVEITGTGKSFWAWEYSNGYFEYAAANGTMNVAGDIELGNTWSPFYNNSLSFGIYGSGNTVNVASGKRVYVTALGGSNNTANTFDFTVQSDDKDAVNTLNVDRIDINAGRNYNDAEIGSTTAGTLTFAGNTKLQSSTNQNTGDTERYSADIFMNNGVVNGGTSKLIVKNSNNVLNIDDLIVNSESASNYSHTPKAIIDISGTGNEINVRWLNLNLNGANASTVFKIAAGNTFKTGYGWTTYSEINANMESGLKFREVYNASTGELSNGTLFEFGGAAVDGQLSVSKIEAQSYNAKRINAFVLLDLSDCYFDLAETDYSIELFTGLSDNTWGADSDFYIKIFDTVVGVGESNDYLSFNLADTGNGKLTYYFNVSHVPEPGTYAAIFGALALAFAFYRKRG